MHEYNNPFRDKESEPWHDAHCMVKGPVVWDLLYHFNERWAYDEFKDEKEIRDLNLKPPPVPNRSNIGDITTVALRTWEGMDRDGGILAWYSNIIRKARDSIYIENQFPFQNEFITRILCKRLQDQKNLRVIVVGPMEPNLPGLVGSILSRTSINDVTMAEGRWRQRKSCSNIFSCISTSQVQKTETNLCAFQSYDSG